MGQHLDHRALQGLLAAGVDADQHEAHVRDAGERHQALDVGLGEGQEGSVEDADQAQGHGDRRELGRGVREQRQGEAQQAVGRGLQQDARQVHGTCGRRLGVSVRQPGVERHHRQLHREGDEEAQHQEVLDAGRQFGLEQVAVVEGDHASAVVVDQHQAEDRHQHDQAAGLGEDEELGRRVDAGLLAVGGAVTPERDEEVHRHQHHFPEEEEQEQVQGQEHADHAAEDPHQVEVEEADVALDLFPRAQHRQHAEQAGEQDHQQRQAVEGQVDADAEALDPLDLVFEGPGGLRARGGSQGVVAVRPQPQADAEQQGHGQQRDPARQGGAEALTQPAQEAADEGDQDQPRQNHDGLVSFGKVARFIVIPRPLPRHRAPARHPRRSRRCTSAAGRSRSCSWRRDRREPGEE